MQTKQEVEAAFRRDLIELLAKYNAEIEAEDHYPGYSECGEDIRMTVDIPAIYGKNGDTIREWTRIDIGRWLTFED